MWYNYQNNCTSNAAKVQLTPRYVLTSERLVSMASPIIPQKQCVRCKQEFPATREYFHADGRGGLRTRCKSCVKNFPDERVREKLPDGIQRCPTCKQLFPATLEFFAPNKSGRYGFHSVCRSCRNEYNHKYVLPPESRKHKNDYEAKRRLQPEYREYNKKRGQEYRESERGKLVCQTKARRDRAKRRGSEGFHTADDVILQYRSQNGKCWHCGKKLNNKFEVDHLIPIDKGGTNWPNNIVCSCRKCNRSKGGKYTYEWNGRLF